MISTPDIILREYKKAFKNLQNKKVIDLDKHLLDIDCFLVRMEDLFQKEPVQIPASRQSRFGILYVSKGSGTKKIGSYNFPVKDRTLMIVPSRVINSARYSGDSKGFYLSFNLDFFLQEQFPRHYLLKMNLFNYGISPFVYLSAFASKKFIEIFEEIEDETIHHRKNRKELLALKILELILQCDRVFTKANHTVKPNHPPLLIRYIDLIQERYKDDHSPANYARHLHVHPNTLNALTRRHLGQSAKGIIETKLVAEAKHLLSQTSLSAKEISYELGFHNPSNFFRFFKKKTNHSPTEFRKGPFEYALN